MKFSELPESERVALKERARRETLVELWEKLPTSSTDSWNSRAVIAADMLKHIRSVTDIGCAGMDLERCMPGKTYVPVDCVRRDARTIVIDLNRESVPALYTEAAALLGVIEYIHDVPGLLSDLSRKYPWVIVSYNQADGREDVENNLNTWVNSYKKLELEDIFLEAGFDISRQDALGGQTIWLLKSKIDSLTMLRYGFDFMRKFAVGYDDRMQISSYQAQVIGAAIRSRAPDCRLLVFGAGHDTGLWLSLNEDGETHVLESSSEWMDHIKSEYPTLSIDLFPSADLTVEKSLGLTLTDMDRYDPPADLANKRWDVILVDGPPGYSPADPGRAIAIAWAARLANPQTHVFVDDYERPLERKFADGLLAANRNSSPCIVSASKHKSHRELFWSPGSPTIEDSKKPVVLTIATKDYCREWRFCIDSQHVYCDQYKYDHHVIDPIRSTLHPKWAKMESALNILDDGRDVLLIDADAEIAVNCPPFTQILADNPQYDIMSVLGISGRPNSGVLILKGGSSSIAAEFLRECIAHRNEAVPPEDFVTKEGENGHVIWLLKHPRYRDRAGVLDKVWNCSDPALAPRAYIRHYTNLLRDELRNRTSDGYLP